jgi:hypothetical protein
MDGHDSDKAAIMAVLRAETDAWLRRDFSALARYWVQSPQTRKMASLTSFGTNVFEGRDAIAANFRS